MSSSKNQFPATSSPLLFDETFMHRLEQLSLITRRVRAGRGKGERRSTKRGSSVEFADYRNYTPGDDLRRLDWRVYARLGRPFIKLFEEEEDQNVHLVLDASGSMDWPEADNLLNKWNFSRKLAVALGYIVLSGGDRLTLSCLSQTDSQSWGTHRSKGHIYNLMHYLSSLSAGGQTDLNTSLRHITAAHHRPGLLFLITDFFSPVGYERGLSALGSAGYEINVLHLLSPDEINPPLTGDLRLHDVETGLTQEITINPTMRHLYQQRFELWRGGIEKDCLSHNMNYITLNTSLPFEEVIAGYLRQRGFLQ